MSYPGAAPAYPSGTNTYVPEVSAKLTVDFSRNIDDFPVNRYVQMVPVEKNVGYYTQMTRAQAGRILEVSGSDIEWPDGADRPSHNDDVESFAFQLYGTKRYDFGFNAGSLAIEQASFDVIAHNGGNAAERAMRWRTQKVVSNATNSANYPSSHVLNVPSISGNTGTWDQSTTARKDIERSFHTAAALIIQDSLNGVKPKDLCVVISIGCALEIKLSQEIINYIKGSVDAIREIRGDLEGQNPNSYWGLPSQLFGYELIIEDTYKVTSFKGASSLTTVPILANTTPFMCSRVGSLVSERSSESSTFSTHTLFMKEEMTVEQFPSAKHRRVEHHVTEDFQAVVTAPIAGVLFTGATTT